MKKIPRRLETERMILRWWRDEDDAPFAEMSADPRVMEFFTNTLSPTEVRETIERIRAGYAKDGFGIMVMERKSDSDFLGIAGIFRPTHEAAYTPCFEIGWRLKNAAWGQGYATEAARRLLAFAFTDLSAPEVVAVTAPGNVRSRRVMERLGMIHCPDEDFDHPRVPAGHPLCRHVLYRLSRERYLQWEAGRDE